MRKVVFGINITLDGGCDHTNMIADDELHEYFTGLLRNADVEIFGRNTYHLMYPYWHDVAMNQFCCSSDYCRKRTAVIRNLEATGQV